MTQGLFETVPRQGKCWYGSCYSEDVEVHANFSLSLTFSPQTVDISVELRYAPRSPSLCSGSINCNFLINFLCSMPIGFEASLQALSAVLTGHNQSWWMWRTVNVCGAIFYADVLFERKKKKKERKGSRLTLSFFCPYLCERPALRNQMQGIFFFSSSVIT